AAIEATQPHFVRCLKPNEHKRAGVLDGASVLRQLRRSGTLSVVALRRAGFAHRVSHAAFLQKFRCLADARGVAAIEATQPHFVRCLKPNEHKRAGVLDGASVLRQLRRSGTLSVVALRRAGFAHRVSHAAFLQKFRCLADARGV
ncbi:MAG: hypothetical protein MHM6MM_009639, partial [Cercozoa sp. M6MM]